MLLGQRSALLTVPAAKSQVDAVSSTSPMRPRNEPKRSKLKHRPGAPNDVQMDSGGCGDAVKPRQTKLRKSSTRTSQARSLVQHQVMPTAAGGSFDGAAVRPRRSARIVARSVSWAGHIVVSKPPALCIRLPQLTNHRTRNSRTTLACYVPVYLAGGLSHGFRRSGELYFTRPRRQQAWPFRHQPQSSSCLLKFCSL